MGGSSGILRPREIPDLHRDSVVPPPTFMMGNVPGRGHSRSLAQPRPGPTQTFVFQGGLVPTFTWPLLPRVAAPSGGLCSRHHPRGVGRRPQGFGGVELGPPKKCSEQLLPARAAMGSLDTAQRPRWSPLAPQTLLLLVEPPRLTPLAPGRRCRCLGVPGPPAAEVELRGPPQTRTTEAGEASTQPRLWQEVARGPSGTSRRGRRDAPAGSGVRSGAARRVPVETTTVTDWCQPVPRSLAGSPFPSHDAFPTDAAVPGVGPPVATSANYPAKKTGKKGGRALTRGGPTTAGTSRSPGARAESPGAIGQRFDGAGTRGRGGVRDGGSPDGP